MRLSLLPPIVAYMGWALVRLAGDLGAAFFVGEDIGDLPAFDALYRMAAGGLPPLGGW
jgi:hypothetical protein